MRAFTVAWRAIAGLYGELFYLIGMSLLWWITGGLFVGIAAAVGVAFFASGGPWWVAPVIAIPAGPATAALAAVCRRVVRNQPHDRQDYLDALKRDWKQALTLSAVGMIVLALVLLNAIFYLFQTNNVLRFFAIVWIYIVVFWLGMQFFLYPFFAALEEPSVLRSYKMAALATFANPLFAALLLLLALILTALCVALPVLALLLWPALMALMGEYALRLLLVRAGVEKEDA